MADNLSPVQRSRLMSKVSGRDTKPEIIVRQFLFRQGFRYRINVRTLPGSPDIVMKRYKTIVFVHGCFWHGHKSCRAAKLPKTHIEFWQEKREKNLERDARIVKELKSMGWAVIVVWECEIKNKTKRGSRLPNLLKEICDPVSM